MATTIPLKLKKAQVNGSAVDFDTDTIKCALVVAGSGAPDVTSTGVQFVSDVTTSNTEVTGTGYARQTLAGLTVAFSGSTVIWTFSNVTFSQNAAGFTNARYAVFYKDAGVGDSTNPVVAVADLTADQSVVSGDLILQCPTGGLIVWS